jgi:hypothetical protein
VIVPPRIGITNTTKNELTRKPYIIRLPSPEHLEFIIKRRHVQIVTIALIAALTEEIPARCNAIIR